MRLSNEVFKFTGACEHLLAGIVLYRPLTHEEVLLVKHYCNEVLIKVDQLPANPAQGPIPPSQ